jgi:hypothetical protein
MTPSQKLITTHSFAEQFARALLNVFSRVSVLKVDNLNIIIAFVYI